MLAVPLPQPGQAHGHRDPFSPRISLEWGSQRSPREPPPTRPGPCAGSAESASRRNLSRHRPVSAENAAWLVRAEYVTQTSMNSINAMGAASP